MKKLFITATLLLLLSLKPLFGGIDKGIYAGDVAEVQIMLTELCFKPGPIDGTWGKKTETAFKDFYKPYGKYDGTFDNFELRMLKGRYNGRSKNKKCKPATIKFPSISQKKEIKIADKGVCKIQELLSQQGYNVGLIDGVFGKKQLTA